MQSNLDALIEEAIRQADEIEAAGYDTGDAPEVDQITSENFTEVSKGKPIEDGPPMDDAPPEDDRGETNGNWVEAPQGDDSGRPRLPAKEVDLAVITEITWGVIQKTNEPPTLFRHGDQIARLEKDDQDRPITREVTRDRLRYHLSRIIAWYVLGKKKAEIPEPPPMDVVRNLLATPNPPLPVLTRIVESPVFAPDGSLLTEPGYHAAGKTFYAPQDGFTVPPVSEAPTQEETQEAVRLLSQEVLGDFPFVDQADKAHVIAMTLLPFVRDMIHGPTPLHDVEASSPGTGKTKMIQVTTTISAGKMPDAMAEGGNDDEWRKRITAKLSTAPSILFIDNVRKRLDSGALAAALTAYPGWEDRRLGFSEMVSYPVRCVWILSANNPVFSSELTRRTIRIRLDAKQDRPWLRTGFRHTDLVGWVERNRGHLVWACLTIIRAWLAAGRPPGKTVLGMYESWARVMGGILDVANIPGFLSNLEAFYDVADAEGATWREFLLEWHTKYGGEKVKAADLFSFAVEAGMHLGTGSEQSQKTTLGKRLVEQRDRVYAVKVSETEARHLKIESGGTVRRATVWKLTEAGDA